MLEDYRRARISSEIRSRAAATGTGTFVTHHPDTSKCIQLAMANSDLQKQNELLKIQILAAESRAAQCEKRTQAAEQQAKGHEAALHKVKKAGEVFKRRFYRCRHRLRKQADLGLEGAKLFEVRNICMDPNRKRDEWEKRKRDPSLAYEYALIMIRGNKEPRPIGGGVRWTVEARFREFQNFARSGILCRHC
jgi:hypothetical protein